MAKVTTPPETSLKSKQNSKSVERTEQIINESNDATTAIADDVPVSEDNDPDDDDDASVAMDTASVAMDTSFAPMDNNQEDNVPEPPVSMDTASVSDEELLAATADAEEPPFVAKTSTRMRDRKSSANFMEEDRTYDEISQVGCMCWKLIMMNGN